MPLLPELCGTGTSPSAATPLTWDEVGAVTGPDDLRFSPEDVLARLAEHGDLAADLLGQDHPPLPGGQ